LDDRSELFPLFFGEARARVERLLSLIPRLGFSAGAAGEARRELHTLKGACRLMGLGELGDLCAEGEGLMESIDDGTAPRVAALAERFRLLLLDLEGELGSRA
jgi:chemotaxis protein histidine kinase CheA